MKSFYLKQRGAGRRGREHRRSHNFIEIDSALKNNIIPIQIILLNIPTVSHVGTIVGTRFIIIN